MNETTTKSGPTPGPWHERFIFRMIQAARNSKDMLIETPKTNDWADACLMASAPDFAAACTPERLDALDTLIVECVVRTDYADMQAISPVLDKARRLLRDLRAAVAKSRGEEVGP